LTTVQVCDAEDQKGALLLGKHQYIIDRTPRVETVVVMHHPPEWIKDRHDACSYLDSRARVQIFGHEHFQEIQGISNANHEMRLVICSGAVTPEDATAPYIYRYNILDFALKQDIGDPFLAVTISPRLWVPENTGFDADTARLGGHESTTFVLTCPQFRLAAPETTGLAAAAGSHEGVATVVNIEDAFIRINYFFWRYLNWQDQLKVLTAADVLPTTPELPNLQTISHKALDRARVEAKLGDLWDKIMLLVPDGKREPNPFI